MIGCDWNSTLTRQAVHRKSGCDCNESVVQCEEFKGKLQPMTDHEFLTYPQLPFYIYMGSRQNESPNETQLSRNGFSYGRRTSYNEWEDSSSEGRNNPLMRCKTLMRILGYRGIKQSHVLFGENRARRQQILHFNPTKRRG